MAEDDLSLRQHHACKQLSEHKAVDAYRAAIKIGRGFVGGLALGLACQSPCSSPRRAPRQPATEKEPPVRCLRLSKGAPRSICLRHSKSVPQNIDGQSFVEAVMVPSRSVPENMDAIAERLSRMDADGSAMLVVCPTPAQDDADDDVAAAPAAVAGAEAHAYVGRASSLPLVESTTPVSREMPAGWEQWLDPGWLDQATANGGFADDSDSSSRLPVCVFVSSTARDRKVTKDCQWVLDFLRNKRVPFELVDLARQPKARQRMARLSGDEQSLLPQVQFRGESVGIDRLKDLEDHYELGPKLRTEIRRYAASLSLLKDGNSPSRWSPPACGPPLAGQLSPPRASFPPPPPFGRTATAPASAPVAADVVAAAEAAAKAAAEAAVEALVVASVAEAEAEAAAQAAAEAAAEAAAAEAAVEAAAEAVAASAPAAAKAQGVPESRVRSVLDEARAQLESERARRRRCEAALESLRRSTADAARALIVAGSDE